MGGLVEGKDAVDLAVVQPEDRVEGGGGNGSHVFADVDVYAVVDVFGRGGEGVKVVCGEEVEGCGLAT